MANQRALGTNLMTSLADLSMPQDSAAEASVLASMLMSAEALQDCLEALSPDDFYLPSHKIIFEIMRDMFNKNLPVDLVSLADYLSSQGVLDQVGGRGYLVDLGSNALALGSYQHHIEIIRRHSTLRMVITAAAQITSMALDAPEDTKSVVESAEKMIMDVTDRDMRSNDASLSDVLASLYSELNELAASPEQAIGVQTSFPTLDKQLLGLRPGQMVVVGARPGVGKTSFALNLAVGAAAAGASVAFFSLEMSKTEIAQRLLSSQSRVPLTDIRSGRIKDEHWSRLLEATSTLSRLDITIDDDAQTTVTEIRAKARRMLRGKERGVAIIDYLQLVTPTITRGVDSRATAVSEMSRGIKIMAKDINIPVIALSQLNRQTEQRTTKRPQLSDLRESGSIEQDADIVLLLDRSMTEEEAGQKNRPEMGVTQLIIAKNRSGPLGIVDLTFLAGSTKFVELSKAAV